MVYVILVAGFAVVVAAILAILAEVTEIRRLLANRPPAPVPIPPTPSAFAPTLTNDPRTMWDPEDESEDPENDKRWIDRYAKSTGQYPDDGWGTDDERKTA